MQYWIGNGRHLSPRVHVVKNPLPVYIEVQLSPESRVQLLHLPAVSRFDGAISPACLCVGPETPERAPLRNLRLRHTNTLDGTDSLFVARQQQHLWIVSSYCPGSSCVHCIIERITDYRVESLQASCNVGQTNVILFGRDHEAEKLLVVKKCQACLLCSVQCCFVRESVCTCASKRNKNTFGTLKMSMLLAGISCTSSYYTQNSESRNL